MLERQQGSCLRGLGVFMLRGLGSCLRGLGVFAWVGRVYVHMCMLTSMLLHYFSIVG